VDTVFILHKKSLPLRPQVSALVCFIRYHGTFDSLRWYGSGLVQGVLAIQFNPVSRYDDMNGSVHFGSRG
jgi:hypothetical protein